MIFANDAAGRFFGFDADAAIGTTYLTRIRLRLPSGSSDAVRLMLSESSDGPTRPSWKTSCIAHRPDGSVARCDVVSIVVNGRYAPEICLFVHDTQTHTEQCEKLETLTRRLKERNTALRHAKQDAKISSFRKSEVLANMSHEIRNPMTGILGALSLLGKTSLDERAAKWVSIAHNSATSLLGLLNDILDLSRIESGGMVLANEDFHLPTLIDEVISINAIRAREKRIALSSEYDYTLGGWFQGDASRVRQIVNNLVDNAIKFTNEGGVVLSVQRGSTSSEPSADSADSTGTSCTAPMSLRVTVTDSGCGISREELPLVFSRHSQAASSRRLPNAGAGLGLAISRSLAQLLGGDLDLTSEVGTGTTATFSLELMPRPLDSPRKPNYSHLRVLIASPCKYTRGSLARTIASTGAYTITESDTSRVIAHCVDAEESGLTFDVVFIDATWHSGNIVTPLGLKLMLAQAAKIGSKAVCVVDESDSLEPTFGPEIPSITKPMVMKHILAHLTSSRSVTSRDTCTHQVETSKCRPNCAHNGEDHLCDLHETMAPSPDSLHVELGLKPVGALEATRMGDVESVTAAFVLDRLPEHLLAIHAFLSGDGDRDGGHDVTHHAERAGHYLQLIGMSRAAKACQDYARLTRSPSPSLTTSAVGRLSLRDKLAKAVEESMAALPLLLATWRSSGDFTYGNQIRN